MFKSDIRMKIKSKSVFPHFENSVPPCGFQEYFCIRGAYLLKRFVLSPYEVLTGLKRLDIGCMDELEFVLIQVMLAV